MLCKFFTKFLFFILTPRSFCLGVSSFGNFAKLRDGTASSLNFYSFVGKCKSSSSEKWSEHIRAYLTLNVFFDNIFAPIFCWLPLKMERRSIGSSRKSFCSIFCYYCYNPPPHSAPLFINWNETTRNHNHKMFIIIMLSFEPFIFPKTR